MKTQINKLQAHYNSETDKLLSVLSALKSKPIKYTSHNKIKKLLDEFCIFDDCFLKFINQ